MLIYNYNFKNRNKSIYVFTKNEYKLLNTCHFFDAP